MPLGSDGSSIECGDFGPVPTRRWLLSTCGGDAKNVCDGARLATVADVELAEDRRIVMVDRLAGDDKTRGDFSTT